MNPNLKIGNIVEVKAPNFYINGKFAVKEINYLFQNDIEESWQIILKNADLVSTYIDIFRPAEREENTNKINTVILSEFVEERINEIHKLDLDNTIHNLNFNL